MKFQCAIGICLIALFQTTAYSQGRKADYERSESLDRRVADKVTREQIQPAWHADGTFWYRVKTGPGQNFQWVHVDPAKASRDVVIDSTQLKNAIDKITENKPNGNIIDELAPVKDSAKVFRIRLGGRWWLWDQIKSELKLDSDQTTSPSGPQMQSGPRASLRQGSETFVTFVNKTTGNAHLQWVDPDGKPKGYGHIAPGQERRQHTFGGHVWRVFDDAGNDLAWIEAEDAPGRVEINQATPANRPALKKADTPKKKRSARPNATTNGIEIRDFNIIRKEPGKDEVIKLTTDGTESDAYQGPLLVSPNGRFLVARRVKPEQKHTVAIVESSPADQLQPKLIEFQYLKPGDRIEQAQPVLIDLSTNKLISIDTSLASNPWSLGEWHWAEDSSEIYFIYNQWGHQVVRLLGLNAATGKLRTVAEEKFDTFVDYPNKIWHHWLPGSKKLVWMSERSGWNHLYLIDVATGTVEKPLTSGEWVVRKVEKADDSSGRIWFYAGGFYKDQDPYYQHLASVGMDDTSLKFHTDADGNHSVTFSPDGQYLLDRYSRVDLPPVHELRDAATGKLILKLESADATALTSAGWTTPERFAANGRDGKTGIYGVIYRPSNFDSSRKYPVIEEIYAGPHGAFVPKSWGLQMRQHKLAELGFVVVQIDGMGTNWRSKAFHDVASRHLADAGYPDRKIWIKEAARTRPWMDLTRVGIYGGSAGGQNAMRALIDHHDFYKVAVADCGCHDNRMDKIWWNELWLGWPVGQQYETNSNSVHAHRMQGKLLLVVGELDRNVDPASTMQVVNALVKANKDFEHLVVPGAGHGAAESPYGSRRRTDFLV
ncbi:MAG: prolyl oligopeptidase family serine peptidase, partial [bacterium]